MTFIDFQEDLRDEVERILKDFQYGEPGGKKNGVNVYSQMLPLRMENEKDPVKKFPHAIVKLSDGETREGGTWKVTATVQFGVYNEDNGHLGYRQVLEMVQKVLDRFAAAPYMMHKGRPYYRAGQDMEWFIYELDTAYPYYYGGCSIRFDVPKIGRADPFAYGRGEVGYVGA